MKPLKILVLYNELNAYNVIVFKELQKDEAVELLVVHNDSNKLIPYAPTLINDQISYRRRSEFNRSTLLELTKQFGPSVIFVNGWMDSAYTFVAAYWKAKGISVASSLDNHWKGTLKQRFLTLIARFTVRRYFSHMFVAGIFQYEYARRLGFPKEMILTGSLPGDSELYGKAHEQRKEWKKNILHMGRIAPIKRVEWIYDTFRKYEDRFPDWTLTIIGNGADRQRLKETDRIRIIDYLEPEDIIPYAVDASVFVHTCLHEHWGVVIHEMTCAGLPIITTDECGAAPHLVVDDLNGFKFKVDSIEDFERVWIQMLEKSPEELQAMGFYSYELSKEFSPLIWVKKFLSIMNG